MTATHSRAWCSTCGAEWVGDDADRRAHLHATSKARGHVRHATTSSTHPRHLCTEECQPRKAKP